MQPEAGAEPMTAPDPAEVVPDAPVVEGADAPVVEGADAPVVEVPDASVVEVPDASVVEEATAVVEEATGVVEGAYPGAGTAPRSDRPHRWVPWTALVVYAICRALSVGAVAVANLFTHNSLLYDLDIWDGAWFLQIVRHGYPAHLPMAHGHVTANTTAFFPLFPLAVRALDVTGLPAGWSALVVSAVTGATAVYGVGLLARHLRGDGAGSRAALLFALFPGTFAFSLGYSEGIAITCVSLGLLALLRRRWWLAGILGAVATGASPVALAFVVSCAWCAGRSVVKERDYRALVAPLLAPVGFVAFMVYLRVHTGVLEAWRLTERGGWKSFPSLVYPFRILGTFLRDPVAPTLTGQILFFCTVAAVVGIVLMVREHQPAPVLLYGVCAVASAAISQPVGLRPRFLMLAFPMIIALGTRYEGRTHRWLVAVSAVLLLGFTALELGSRAVFP